MGIWSDLLAQLSPKQADGVIEEAPRSVVDEVTRYLGKYLNQQMIKPPNADEEIKAPQNRSGLGPWEI